MATREIWRDGVLVATEDIPDPEPEVDPDTEPDLSGVDTALIAEAEEARRNAYDEVIAAGSLSMARINQANRAGMDAYLAVLAG